MYKPFFKEFWEDFWDCVGILGDFLKFQEILGEFLGILGNFPSFTFFYFLKHLFRKCILQFRYVSGLP
jgi:hypothetical protein